MVLSKFNIINIPIHGFQLIIVHKKVLKIHEIFLSNQFNIYPLEVNNKYESNLVSEFEMRPKYGF